MEELDLGKLIREAMEEALGERGHANVLIAGRTGVGKSTLINSVFQGDLATTGQGRPVTENTREITKEGVPLSIFDTRGLEMADFSGTLASLESFVYERYADPNEGKHIHVAWVCITEDSRRVEDAETELTAMLSGFAPVIGVITKARFDDGFRAEVQRLLPEAKNVVRVRAIRERDDDGHTRTPMGLEELIELTAELFPEGHRSALAAAQKADLALKRNRAQGVVAWAAAAAFGIGATPIPLADTAPLVSVQVGMLARISAVYGLSFSSGFLSTLATSTVVGTIATLTGRLIVGGLLKLFPGIGSVAGGAISGSTAAALTTSFGMTYIASLDAVFARHTGESPSEEEVLDEVKRRFRKGSKIAAEPGAGPRSHVPRGCDREGSVPIRVLAAFPEPVETQDRSSGVSGPAILGGPLFAAGAGLLGATSGGGPEAGAPGAPTRFAASGSFRTSTPTLGSDIEGHLIPGRSSISEGEYAGHEGAQRLGLAVARHVLSRPEGHAGFARDRTAVLAGAGKDVVTVDRAKARQRVLPRW